MLFDSEEELNMKWDTYQSHTLESRREMYEQKLFTDVTLVSDDHVKFLAHKTVLAAASPVLKSLLMLNISEGHQILFLKGVHSEELQSLLEYVYLGQASVSLSNVQGFTSASKELGIDLNARDKNGETALDIVKSEIRYGDPGKREVYNQLNILLEEEYLKNYQS